MKYKDQDLICKLERLARGDSDEELEGELKNSELLRKYHENEDLNILLRDDFFCGIDIEPYIYLSGAEASEEVTASDESIVNGLLSGDPMKVGHAANMINEMPDSEKQRFLNDVVSKLKDEDANVRANVVDVLGMIGGVRAVEALKEALKDDNDDVRGVAALSLGTIRDPRAVEALKEALKDVDVGVRKCVVNALGAIGDSRAVEALKEMLNDEDEDVRRFAAQALKRIKAKQSQ